ncbi:MAG: CTP synthase, partial [Bacillota bacterium]|nr:CTP synthase [Bacillota bacterium]
GRLLKNRGFKVTIQKIDPYLNVDAGTMSPLQHGEVFVTDDGTEADLDIGHYERFLDENLTGSHSVTTGKVYRAVIEKERKGLYKGGTVQVIPHVTNEIKDRILKVGEESGADLVIVEIGGTVGDIESLPHLEALRQLRHDLGRGNGLFIHVTLVPQVGVTGEQKTKPTQHSVKELRSLGLQPDIIITRSEKPLSADLREKIALFCDVEPQAVIDNTDVDTIYAVPLILEEQGLADLVLEKLQLSRKEPTNVTLWRQMVEAIRRPQEEIPIAVAGKYPTSSDAYLSLHEALVHAAASFHVGLKIHWLDGEQDQPLPRDIQGIIIPAGFGPRGTGSMMKAARLAREEKIPFLGICLGLHVAAIEWARHVAGLEGADSREFDPQCRTCLVEYLPGQEGAEHTGGTMRLGGADIGLEEGSLAHRLYQKPVVRERHRHRFALNEAYVPQLQESGLLVTGRSREGNIPEILEARPELHPFYLLVQFHPELISRPGKPHPLLAGFLEAARFFQRQRAGRRASYRGNRTGWSQA